MTDGQRSLEYSKVKAPTIHPTPTPTAAAILLACLCATAVSSCSRNDPPVVTADKARQARFEWNLKTLVDPYETAGFANRKWDAPAKRALLEFALARSGVIESNEPSGQIISTNCEAAVKAGCIDPMIAYLHIRFSMDQTNSKEAFMAAFCKTAQDLQGSAYPGIRKFYAWLRAGEQIWHTLDRSTNIPPWIVHLGVWTHAGEGLMEALSDMSTPDEEIYESCHQILEKWQGDKAVYKGIYQHISGKLFANRPKSSVTWLLKGEAYVQMAWDARGGGYADTVSEEEWKGFKDNLKIAENALNEAWKINPKDPRIAVKMMTVELGQGRGRDRMELWFKRAMELAPDNHDACNAKLWYLEPKWHGSEEDLLAFGWECVESTNWRGTVPLILVDAHDQIRSYLDKTNQDAYWKQPEVWPDIQAAYEKFLQINPKATGWYHNYAMYAYRCEQWQALNELIPKLGSINYAFFGGKPDFEKMLRLAKQHAGETNATEDPTLLELKRLNARIVARMNEGKQTESDYADLLTRFDALAAKQSPGKKEDLARILLVEAELYVEMFKNLDKGRVLALRLKRDCPDTEPGKNADKILAWIDKHEGVAKTQRALIEGTLFPDFAEKDLSGKAISIANYKGKVMLIDFWATWCGPCVAELPNVLKTYAKHHDRGFEIIGISLDQDRQKLEEFIAKRGMTWPQYFDGKGWGNKLAVKYGVDSIPATFLLDGEGKIIGRNLRGERLETAVEKALSKR